MLNMEKMNDKEDLLFEFALIIYKYFRNRRSYLKGDYFSPKTILMNPENKDNDYWAGAFRIEERLRWYDRECRINDLTEILSSRKYGRTRKDIEQHKTEIINEIYNWVNEDEKRQPK